MADESADRSDALALIGGGRWARVIASVLADLQLPFASIVIVSQSSAQHPAGEWGSSRFAGFAVVPSIEAAFDRSRIGAAIIANAARAHVASAERLVRAGIPVLIEKPAALTTGEASHLLQIADANRVCVAPGLTFLQVSYLRRFAALLRRKGRLRHMRLEWSDAVGEVRDGERKSYDPGISVAQDVMPHVWSIMASVLGPPIGDIEPKACDIAKGGRWARYELEAREVPCLVTLERDAPARRRYLMVETVGGDHLAIDFTVEPGAVSCGARTGSGDPRWAKRPGPLARQINGFVAARQARTSEAAAQALLGSVALAERCDILLKRRQREWIRSTRPEEELHYALRDLLGGRFYEEGLGRPGDAQALDMWVEGKARQFRKRGDGAEIVSFL